MEIDLFIKKSKKEQIYEYIKLKGRVRTSEIIRFSSSIFHNRGDRDCRDLASEGKIWRMREDIKRIIYSDTKEDVWSVYLADREYGKR